jgi:GH15 family glucan-1,4-alpha-glucosidase
MAKRAAVATNESTYKALPIEDYAMIGDLHTAALVGRNGSLDWLCLPRFDSPACFAALLGDEENGRWLITPEKGWNKVRRSYRQGTLILETEFHTDTGTVAVVDFMPHAGPRDRTDVIRLVEGRAGTVAMFTEMIFRFDYGHIVPWVRRSENGISAIAGPNALRIRTPVDLRGENYRTIGRFEVAAGEKVPFILTCFRSHEPEPDTIDPIRQLEETERWWREWSARCGYEGTWRNAVTRSLITLKALTYNPTGGIVAASTTSLPEMPGGARNWDYRYCWIRDATFTLYALLLAGYRTEAKAWREWLLRAVAGTPDQLQTLYGVAGERRLSEFKLSGLPGYMESRPVRIGNDAAEQFQLDVYGELMDAFHVARAHDVEAIDDAWSLQRALIEFLESNWEKPDEGIWEVRGPRRHFTYSKVMAWVAMDRAVKAIERFHLDGPADHWRALRDDIHADVCRHGFDEKRNSFIQYYGGTALDGALLLLPLVGFLPPDDERIRGTVEAVRGELMSDGLVRRYNSDNEIDGIGGGEGVFLACTFWLADNLAMMGRQTEATALFERLLDLRNDVGLLSEEYDPKAGRLLGNFPQAFSHVALINTAYNLKYGRRAHSTGNEAAR